MSAESGQDDVDGGVIVRTGARLRVCAHEGGHVGVGTVLDGEKEAHRRRAAQAGNAHVPQRIFASKRRLRPRQAHCARPHSAQCDDERSHRRVPFKHRLIRLIPRGSRIPTVTKL